MRRFALLAAVLAAAGCGVGLAEYAVPSGELLPAAPVAGLSGEDMDDEGYYDEDAEGEEEFPAGWGLRGGLAAYLGAKEVDMSPRLAVGLYYHTLESTSRRVEVGVDLTPDLSYLGDSQYVSLTGYYVGFLGESGAAYWKAGGGFIFESRGGDSGTFGVVDVGGGMWIELGEGGRPLFITGLLQMPMGEGGEMGVTILSVNVGYDF